MSLIDLFLTFLKIGTVSFGGGYGMIPLIQSEFSAFMTEEQLLNFIAVSESTPGPIAINMATFIGAKFGGIWGSILATLGVVLPAFIIILLIASIVSGLLKFAGVQSFLKGVRPVVIGLICATGVIMALSVILTLDDVYHGVGFNWRALVIFIVVAGVWFGCKKVLKKNISPIILIFISAVLGMLLYGVLGFV